MGDPAPALPAQTPDEITPEERARVAYYEAQFRALGIDPAELAEESDVTLEENRAWLQGRAPCPWPR